MHIKTTVYFHKYAYLTYLSASYNMLTGGYLPPPPSVIEIPNGSILNFHHQSGNYDYMNIIRENLNLLIIIIYSSNNVAYIEPYSRRLRNHTTVTY